MRAWMLIVLAETAAAQTTGRTWLYEDVTGRGDFRCTKVYDVPAVVAITAFRALVGEEGPGWLYDQTGPTPRRIGQADGWIPFLDANYTWSRPELPAGASTCIPTGDGQILWDCAGSQYCGTLCVPTFTYLPACVNQGCSSCEGRLTLVSSVSYGGSPCCCCIFPPPPPMTPCQRSSVSIQGFALGELPMCRCDSIPSPSTSPTLGPGHDDYSLQRICSDPIIGSDFWIAFTEVPSTGWRPRYLAIAAHHPGGPLTVQPPHACVTGYLYPVPGVVFTHTGNFAVFRVPLPLNPALVGQQFRVQGASRSPTSGCHRFTDGILVTIRP